MKRSKKPTMEAAKQAHCALDGSIVELGLGEIRPGSSTGDLDKEAVEALCESMLESGLLQPIVVTADHEVVFGRHRLEAANRLGWTHILARIVDLDELHQDLAIIDENLVRRKLSVIEEAELLRRRKEIYGQLHPETNVGRAQAAACNRARRGDVSDKLSLTFTKDTAAKTGKSARTIERAVRLGEKLDDQAAETLKGTPAANNRRQLGRIAKLPPEAQRAEAAQIASSTAERTARKAAKPKQTAVQRAAVNALHLVRKVEKALGACGLDSPELQAAVKVLDKAFGRVAAPPEPAKEATAIKKPASRRKPSRPRQGESARETPSAAVEPARGGKEAVEVPEQQQEPAPAIEDAVGHQEPPAASQKRAEPSGTKKAAKAKHDAVGHAHQGEAVASTVHTVVMNNKQYTVKCKNNQWFYQLTAEAGWTAAAPPTVALIEEQLAGQPRPSAAKAARGQQQGGVRRQATPKTLSLPGGKV